MPRKMLTLRVSDTALDHLQKIADGNDVNRSELIRQMLRLGVNQPRLVHEAVAAAKKQEW